MIPTKPDGGIDLLLFQHRKGMIAQNIRLRHTFMYKHTNLKTHRSALDSILLNPLSLIWQSKLRHVEEYNLL